MQFPKQMAIRKVPCCFCNKTIKKNSKTPSIKLECNLKKYLAQNWSANRIVVCTNYGLEI